MEFINIVIILLIVIVIYLIVKFFYMKDYYSKNLVKSNPKSKNLERYNKFKFDAKLKHPKNIFFKIKIGNTNDTHRLIFKLYDSIVPLTSKNFRILASDGVRGKSYKNSIFHRVIKGFMIQGGDIVNSDGTGSISIYGNKFDNFGFLIRKFCKKEQILTD